jgi:hypothetical protein
MKTRRCIVITVLALYAAGIAWGYFRLPWGAVRSLYRDDDIAKAPAVYHSPKMAISPVQLRYLRRALTVPITPVMRYRNSSDPIVPRASVVVACNALVIARVESAVFTQDKSGVTGRDSVYVCLFGAWFPVLTYRHGSGSWYDDRCSPRSDDDGRDRGHAGGRPRRAPRPARGRFTGVRPAGRPGGRRRSGRRTRPPRLPGGPIPPKRRRGASSRRLSAREGRTGNANLCNSDRRIRGFRGIGPLAWGKRTEESRCGRRTPGPGSRDCCNDRPGCRGIPTGHGSRIVAPTSK